MTDKEWWLDDETYYLLKSGKLEEQVNNLQRMVEDECSRRCILETKLEIAAKALKYYAEGTLGSSVAQKALKEMEEE